MSLLERYASDVSYQIRHTIGLDLGAERRHLSSAFGDHFSEHRVGLLLNLVGSQILGLHGLAGWRSTAAVVRMTQRAIRLKNFCGIGLRLRAGRGQATQDACCDEIQNLLSHVLTNIFFVAGVIWTSLAESQLEVDFFQAKSLQDCEAIAEWPATRDFFS